MNVRSRFFVPAPRALFSAHAERPLVVHAVAVRIGACGDVVGAGRLRADILAHAEARPEIAVERCVHAMAHLVARRTPFARKIDARRRREGAVRFVPLFPEHIVDVRGEPARLVIRREIPPGAAARIV